MEKKILPVSIVVPVKNEEKNILVLLESKIGRASCRERV